MSGKGGQKHRSMAQHQKRTQSLMKARASLARARGIFEAKGQAWDPMNNPAQMAAMNHAARRLVESRQHINL